MTGKIFVYFKPDVPDYDLERKQQNVADLGISATLTSSGKFFLVSLATSDRAVAEKMTEDICKKLLANDSVEDYTFEITD